MRKKIINFCSDQINKALQVNRLQIESTRVPTLLETQSRRSTRQKIHGNIPSHLPTRLGSRAIHQRNRGQNAALGPGRVGLLRVAHVSMPVNRVRRRHSRTIHLKIFCRFDFVFDECETSKKTKQKNLKMKKRNMWDRRDKVSFSLYSFLGFVLLTVTNICHCRRAVLSDKISEKGTLPPTELAGRISDREEFDSLELPGSSPISFDS